MALNTPFAVLVSRDALPRPANPFLSPSTDPYNPLKYIASNVLTGITFTLYLLCALTMTFWMWRRGARWMGAMVIGAYTFSVGLALRFVLHLRPESKTTYMASYILIVLSPCAFIAANYVLLGRLARHLRMDLHLLIKPRLITRIFISSDISTFLVQSLGGTITVLGSTSKDTSKTKLGSHIILVGLILQLVSFFTFAVLLLRFLYRVRKHAPHVWQPSPPLVWWRDWRTLAGAMCVSCVGILIRSAYRTVEFSQGFGGPLSISERFFYGLDTVPLFFAIVVYIPFWPTQFIHEETAGVSDSGGSSGTRSVSQSEEKA